RPRIGRDWSNSSTAGRCSATAATTSRPPAITRAAAGTSPRTRSPSTYTRHTAINANRLDELRRRCAEPVPHPDLAALADASRQTLDWVLRYHAALPQARVGRTASRAELEALLRAPPPEAGQDFARVLAELESAVAARAFRTTHPRFLAFVPSAPSFVSVLGDLLCAGTNFFCGVWLEASGPSMVELVVLEWLAEFLGCPKETRGVLTSGGSESN